MKICFFGSSLVSSYWNGAATYYRGLLKALAALGHDIAFYEPDAFARQQHRDIDDPPWARVVVYPATEDGWRAALDKAARDAELLIKASGVGVFDAELDAALPDHATPGRVIAYWDVDAPATLDAIAANPNHHLRPAIPRYDFVFTYGGGEPVVRGYERWGAKICAPVYNALDPQTHYPVPKCGDWQCDLSFLGNRLPDREARVEEFFLKPAAELRSRAFLLGGSGWETKTLPTNVRNLGHVATTSHNAMFCSGLATLNVNRDSMARYGYSPPTRIFEAAGAGACIVTDQWIGIEQFLEPGREILVAANGDEVAEAIGSLTPHRARQIGANARRRMIAEHTYTHRARQVVDILAGATSRREAAE